MVQPIKQWHPVTADQIKLRQMYMGVNQARQESRRRDHLHHIDR